VFSKKNEFFLLGNFAGDQCWPLARWTCSEKGQLASVTDAAGVVSVTTMTG